MQQYTALCKQNNAVTIRFFIIRISGKIFIYNYIINLIISLLHNLNLYILFSKKQGIHNNDSPSNKR